MQGKLWASCSVVQDNAIRHDFSSISHWEKGYYMYLTLSSQVHLTMFKEPRYVNHAVLAATPTPLVCTLVHWTKKHYLL